MIEDSVERVVAATGCDSAALLLYEGRTLDEVAEHLSHADSGFTARTSATSCATPRTAAHHDH